MQKKEWRFALASAVAALLLAAVFAFGRPAAGGGTAHIYVDGREVKVIGLATAYPGVFSLRDEPGVPVDFELKDNRIRFVNVDCPDHICEQTGWVWLDGQTAVCMPNRTAVVITEP